MGAHACAIVCVCVCVCVCVHVYIPTCVSGHANSGLKNILDAASNELKKLVS